MSQQHIRLASPIGTEPVTFTNYFQDPIVLPPHSTVAIKQVLYNPKDWNGTNGDVVIVGSYLTWELRDVPLGKAACRSVYAGTNPGQDDNNGLALMSAVVEDITAEAALVEEENPLNFIPLNNKYPITLNVLGITVRDQTGQIVQYDR